MKKFVLKTLKILLFTAGFITALWWSLSWNELGKFAMNIAHSQLSSRGMRLSYSDVSGESDGFTVHNLTLNGMANFSFNSVTLRPRFLSSILSFAPVCDISFRGGNVQFGQVFNFGDGGTLLTAGREEILLENLRTNGDFSVNGWMTVNPRAMRIGHADAALNFPENFAQGIGTLQNFLPLVQSGGKWYLRRN